MTEEQVLQMLDNQAQIIGLLQGLHSWWAFSLTVLVPLLLIIWGGWWFFKQFLEDYR